MSHLYEPLSVIYPYTVCPQLGQRRLLEPPRNDAKGIALQSVVHKTWNLVASASSPNKKRARDQQAWSRSMSDRAFLYWDYLKRCCTSTWQTLPASLRELSKHTAVNVRFEYKRQHQHTLLIGRTGTGSSRGGTLRCAIYLSSRPSR